MSDLRIGEIYERINKEITAYFDGERDLLANMANCAAILFQNLPQINWAGFYLLKGTNLVLGPFQGKAACTRIPEGKGVCGTAASRRQTIVVPDVHQFPGHISCDSASRSEIVVPLIAADRLLGVLDLDSPILNRFDDLDKTQLTAIVSALIKASNI